jgi:hypothetical protein
MNTTTRTSKVSFLAPTKELMEQVLGSGWDTFSWWKNYNFAPNCDLDTLPPSDDDHYIYIFIDDAEFPKGCPTVQGNWLTVNDIVRGVNAVILSCPWVRWDDLDANDADNILQIALCGSIIYG